jgi:hydrogenase maturation protease
VTTSSRVLVAGIGNVFLGDDGFGPEVARRLAADGQLPDGVEVADIGIRGSTWPTSCSTAARC